MAMSGGRRLLGMTVWVSAGVLPLAVAALSMVHPWGNLHAASASGGSMLAGAEAPEDVRGLLARKCGDCHSDGTEWPLYSRVAPASWLVEHDVHEGRDHMNLSRWQGYAVDSRIDLLSKIASQVRDGKMPLRQYVLLHPQARLTDAERKQIQSWAKAERKRLLSQEAK